MDEIRKGGYKMKVLTVKMQKKGVVLYPSTARMKREHSNLNSAQLKFTSSKKDVTSTNATLNQHVRFIRHPGGLADAIKKAGPSK